MAFRRHLRKNTKFKLYKVVERQYSCEIQNTCFTVINLFKTRCTKFYQNGPNFFRYDENILAYFLLGQGIGILTTKHCV